MKRSAILGAVLLAAFAAALTPAMVSPAAAGGWWHRDGYAAPRYYRKSYRSVPRVYDGSVRYYNSPRAYRAACAYGDCVCLRNTSSPAPFSLRCGGRFAWPPKRLWRIFTNWRNTGG